MAKMIQAINAYRPRIARGGVADEKQYMNSVTDRTTLSSGVVKNVQESRKASLIKLLLAGSSVHTGGAIYSVSIGLDGKRAVKVRPDPEIVAAVNMPGTFRGKIINADNIGKSSSELADMWDAQHPDDPIER